MEKTKGVVMRTSPKVTVIYTEKCDFLEIPTPKEPPVVGQTIEVNLNPKRLSVFHNSALKYIAVAAVLLLALSISVFSLLFIPNMAIASVALDINNNKGVELSINKEGKVIKALDVNGGSSILEGISTKGLDVYQAVDLIVENANQKGMLNETQNLVMASVVPINNSDTQIIDTGKLRSTIRDEMTRRNLSGSVVVSQANQKIQQEATQQGMTVNRYLIYDRSKKKGIAVQPNTLRNDVQKALMDANVTVVRLFPEESFEVGAIAQNLKDNSIDTKKETNVQNGPEDKQPSNMESTENHGYMEPSVKQNPPSGSTSGNGMKPNAPSHSPVKQPMQGTSPDSNKPGSVQNSPSSMPQSSSPQQPTNPSYNGEMGQENPIQNETGINTQSQSNWPQKMGEP